MEATRELDFDRFVEAFIAGLVGRGVVSLSPSAPETNQRLSRMSAFLNEELERIDHDSFRKWVRRVRNQLSPGNLGTYDSFYSALRAKQMGYVASPNPKYRDVNFKISPAFANNLLRDLDDEPRDLVNRAVDAFLGVSQSNQAL
jgi:hypothetical protein